MASTTTEGQAVPDLQTSLTADPAEPRRERAPRVDRGERGEGRRERGERGEGRRERSERAPRRDETETRADAGTTPETAAAQPSEHATNDTTANLENGELHREGGPRAEGEERRERRSRDRYGRDRRERGNGERENRAPEESAPASGETGEAMEAPVVRSYFDRPSSAAPAPVPAEVPVEAPEAASLPATASTEPVALVTATVQPNESHPPVTALTAGPAETAVPLAVPASVVVTPTANVTPFVLPVDDLAQMAANAGLSWVNSDESKVAAVQAAIAAEPKPSFVPRERPPAIVVDAGPLVLVETRKDLRNLPLPF